MAFIEILKGEIIKSTRRVVLTFINPPPAIISLLPTVSLVASPVKTKYPESEEKTTEEISGSFGSWLVINVMEVVSLQTEDAKEIATEGEKGIHGKAKVLPPTQLPQLSIHALPLGTPSQSKGKLVVWNVSAIDHPEFPAEQ